MHKKRISAFLVGLLTISFLTGCSQNKKESADISGKQIEIQVAKGDIKEEIYLSGSIKASKLASVSGVSSSVEEIYVSSNEDVLEGEDIILLTNGNVIEAPFDGKITKISVSEGDVINTSTTVFNIASKDSFQINASISESEITKVKVGQKVDVLVSATNKQLSGTITSIEGEATSSGNSTTFGIVISLEGDFKNLYSGMTSEMTITINESNNTLMVPIESVKNQKGKYIVSVKDGDSTKDVEVSVGIQTSTMAEITSGLSEEDTIVYTQELKTNYSNSSSRSEIKGNGMSDMNPNMQMPSGAMPPDMPSNKK